MRIACTTLACPDWPLGTVLERFAGYGYDAVDFRGLAGQMEVWRLGEFADDLDATRARLEEARLAVSGFSSSARMFDPDPSRRERHVDEVRQYARLCRAFDAPMIRVFGGAVGDVPMPDAVPAAVEALTAMADAAGEGVTVAVETHDDWVRTAPLAEVVARVDRPDVGVLWDLHHPYRAGESPEQTCANIGDRTVGVHVKDSRPAADGRWTYCLPGDGDVPLADMVARLIARGYRGDLTLEWEKAWHPEIADPDVALPAYAEFMRDLAATEAPNGRADRRPDYR